jgi:hypothetical protein
MLGEKQNWKISSVPDSQCRSYENVYCNSPKETMWSVPRRGIMMCAPGPLQRPCSPFSGGTVSKQPAAVRPLLKLPQLQRITSVESHSFMGWSLANESWVLGCKVVLFPVSGHLWRSSQLHSSLWCWLRLLLDPPYNSALPDTILPLFFFVNTCPQCTS